MNNFNCIVQEGSKPEQLRGQLASESTRIGSAALGEQAEGSRSKFPNEHHVDGGNRVGRPEEVKQKLINDLIQAFSRISNVPAESVGGRITESPASWSLAPWSMKGGAVLPQPGEEGAEWHAHVS